MDLNRFLDDGKDTLWVSVSLERTGPCNLHAGIVYRQSDDKLRRVHFGWHRQLYDVEYQKVACAVPHLDVADAMWMSAFCGRIARHASANEIPYNLKYDEDVAFDPETGEIIFGVNSSGLGCATFVLAVFRSAGNGLVDVTDWPEANADDKAVQREFVNALLKSSDADKRTQGERISGEVGTKRIRPDHVAGACLEDTLPVKYPECEANGLRIVAKMDELAPFTPIA
jgi:hypothetical protein